MLPAVRQGVGGDAQQPRGKRNAAPLKTPQVHQGLAKDLGSDVLGLIAIANPPRNEGVDAMEVALVKLREPARILLRRFDKEPLVGKIASYAQVSPWRPNLLCY